MARKVLIEQYYTFTPATRTVVIPKAIQRENLILVTNVTQNKVIYNFSDPNLTATAYTVNNGVTTVVLNFNTTTMSSTDSLQFTYDDTVQEITPSEILNDPVSKLRVSTPQSLIDTDFEYGLQPTKWEILATLNGRPSFFIDTQVPISIADVRATNASRSIELRATYTNATGNLTATTASATITNTSGVFDVNVFVGNAVYDTSDAFVGIIGSIESSTSATLTSNAAVNIGGAGWRFAPQQIPTTGLPILVQETLFPQANGGFLVESTTPTAGSGYWSLSYTASARFTGTTGSILNSSITVAYQGQFYSNSLIATSVAPTATQLGSAPPIITFTTTRNHGITVGNLVYVLGTTNSAGTAIAPRSYVVHAVYSPTKFSVAMPVGSTIPTSIGGTTQIYVRNEATHLHRSFDGGVRFSPNNFSHNYQAIRQSRRYFRYQSGKGIQFSTGSVLRPTFTLDGLTSVATLCTATTKEPHNLAPGVAIKIAGALETEYNGSFTVVDVNSEFEFTYNSLTTPSLASANGYPEVTIESWKGASIRIGMFDQQNGFFFDYDGADLYAVRRSSTQQLSGLITATNGSDVIDSVTTLGTGKQTKFTSQLKPGDWIVVRGQSHRVMEVISNTKIRINPEYRGNNIAAGNISLTTDTKFPRAEWNIDRCDGNGPSGFTIDFSKMQMLYADYAWYGAGAIRFGFKEQNGNIIYCHRITHANKMTEAYMRSGNLPGRYEVNTFVPYTYMTASLASGANTLTVASTTDFPNSGTLLIGNPGVNSSDAGLGGGGPGVNDYHEYVTYTSKTPTTFTLATRGAGRGMTGTANTGYQFTFTTATTTNNSNTLNTITPAYTINSIGNANNMVPVGAYVSGTNIPEGTFIVSYTASTIELSQSATGSGVISDFTVYAMSSNINGSLNNGPTHTYNATGPIIPVYLHSPQFSPTANHWGTAVIMDGRYDDDKSLVFTAGNPSFLSNFTNTPTALLSLRSCPSVDNGVGGVLGTKEVINRMQLTLRSLGVVTNGSFFIRLVLNPRFVTNAPSFTNLGGSSLSQVEYHATNTQVTGGETIFAFFSDQGGGGLNYSTTTSDLSLVRDIGNSILGGGTTNNLDLTSATSRGYAGVYPDGPDIVTIVCQNVLTPARNVTPATVTNGSPIAIFNDVSNFDVGWSVTATSGGIAVNGIIRSITARSAGGYDVAFSKNATTGSAGVVTLSPPGNIGARLSWTEAQA